MTLRPESLIRGLERSRRHFLRHLDGLPDAAWTFKPYPEAKSVLEGLLHLRLDDLAALGSLQTGGEPDYEGLASESGLSVEDGPEALLDALAASHRMLLGYLRERYADAPLEEEITVWGTKMPLGEGIPYFSSEDYYHAGQVAYVRLAVQPDWNYYRHIYGHG